MQITVPDLFSFSALFFSWTGLILLGSGLTEFSIILNFIAVAFDYFDGRIARRFGKETILGRYIDSYSDVFIYLVFPSIVYVKFLSPNIYVGTVVSFMVILLGGLRLIIFNMKGIVSEKGNMYYTGLPVIYIFMAILLMYCLRSYGNLTSWVTTVLLMILSPLLLGSIKVSKRTNFFSMVIFMIVFIILNFLRE